MERNEFSDEREIRYCCQVDFLVGERGGGGLFQGLHTHTHAHF